MNPTIVIRLGKIHGAGAYVASRVLSRDGKTRSVAYTDYQRKAMRFIDETFARAVLESLPIGLREKGDRDARIVTLKPKEQPI